MVEPDVTLLEGAVIKPTGRAACVDVIDASSVNMDPNTTILRVKRKRGTDPADALLLACKRIRPETAQSSDESVPEPSEGVVENSVFKLVATVATQVRGPLTTAWR